MDMAIRKSQRTFTSRLAPFTTGDKKHLQQSASIMKGMAMKENDLTYELICAAVNGEKTALEEILRFYDDYINALATVKGEDAQGKTYRYIDEDLKARIQLKLIKAIPKWRGTKK
ncbi:helix-turn-helix domain-containing protein [Ruminococcus sp. OM06-36AC]|nr:helix-turn-helix domain-containing protein [Ruminococcus sp. OM06-36AC]